MKLVATAMTWIFAIVPFLALLTASQDLPPSWFISLLIFYSLVYRPLLLSFRLASLGVLSPQEAWKTFIPFRHAQYIRRFWLG